MRSTHPIDNADLASASGLDNPTLAIRYRYNRFAPLIAIVVGLPVFVTLSPSGIGPPTGPTIAARGASLGLPISLLVIIAAVSLSVRQLRSSARFDVAGGALGVFLVINTIALFAGAVMNDFSIGSVAFYVQTLLPMSAYLFGTQLFVGRHDSLRQTYRGLFYVPVLSLIAIALTTLFSGGQPWVDLGERLGPLDIPQILRYVPTVFAGGLVGFAHHNLKRGSVSAMNVGLALTSLVLLTAVHARTSLLVVICGALVTIVADPTTHLRKRLVLGGWAALAALLASLVLPGLTSGGPVALDRLVGDNEAAQLSSERRSEALFSSLTESFTTPIGRAYVVAENTTLGGATSSVTRVSNSENQLGEFGLRAGPVAVISAVVLITAILLAARRTFASESRSEDESFMVSMWVAAAAMLLGSIFTQQPLSQPFTGLFIWLMLGLLRGWTTSQVELDVLRQDMPRTAHGSA